MYSAPHVATVRRMRTTRHVALIGGIRNSYKMFVGTPQDKITRRKTRRKCGDNIKIDLGETGCECVEFI